MVMFFKPQAMRILIRDTKKSDASSCPCDFKVVLTHLYVSKLLQNTSGLYITVLPYFTGQ